MPRYEVIHGEGEQLTLLEIGTTQPVATGEIRPKSAKQVSLLREGLGSKDPDPGDGDRTQNGELRIGMMWFDAGPGTLEEKVQRAAERYRAKHGRWPNTCKVNEGAITGDFTVGNVRVMAARKPHPVLPGHFFLGVVDGRV